MFCKNLNGKSQFILVLLTLLFASAGAAYIESDINNDGSVDLKDLEILAVNWLDLQCTNLNCGDVGGSSGVNLEDYAALAMDWLKLKPPIISEFMASNGTTLETNYYPGGPAEYPDWIELHNTHMESSFNLEGWSLKDDNNQWQFPSGATITPGGYVVVFASGQDMLDPYGYYHTNFQLEKSGEYLALVSPDGTVVFEYTPQYPLQTEDVSFGLSTQTILPPIYLLDFSAFTQYFVPTSNSLGTSWTQTSFNASSWSEGHTGVGYERSPGSTPEQADYSDLIQTDVESIVYGSQTSVYLRVPFSVTNDIASLQSLKLYMKYDDGFVAYLNGTEVARSHVSVSDGVTPDFDDVGVNHIDAEAIVYEEFDITQHAGLLNDGSGNILAVHGLNQSLTSSDFLIVPVLSASFSDEGDDEAVPMFFDVPTPGSQNLGGTPYVTSPEFNPTSQLFTTSFDVELSDELPTAVIYYTLDGSEPSLSSAVYSTPISISNSTIVKAKAYESGIGWSKTAVQGYSKLNADVQSFSSNLPIVVLDTFGSSVAGTDSTDYTVVYSSFIDVDPDTGRASITGPADHIGMNGIRVRGHSSPTFCKKSYKFETWDDNLDDKNVSLLGLPADSDWTLHGPIWDKALIRNLITYQWSNEIGRYAARTRLVEMFLDTNGGDVKMDNLASVTPYPDCTYPGDYLGVYLLTEKLTRSQDRVDIEKLEPYQNASPEITGGYFLQYDCCHHVPYLTCDYGDWLLEEPKPWDISAAQESCIEIYLNTVHASLSNSDPTTGYRKYIDTGSYIDLFLLSELTREVDAYMVSTYAFKDRLGKFNMGPLWDINGSFGNMNFAGSWPTAGWQLNERGGIFCGGYDALLTDVEYKLEMWDRWFSLRENVWRTEKLLNEIEYWAAYLNEAQERNYQRWPVLNEKIYLVGTTAGNLYGVLTYREEIDVKMKPWLAARVAWIDSQFIAPPVFNHNQEGGEFGNPPKAHWKLDESSGAIASDSSGNDHDGALQGDPIWQPTSGQIDGALQFDGVDDYVVVTGYKGITGTQARTCSAWIKTTQPSAQIINWGSTDDSGAEWVICLNSDGALCAVVGGGSIYGVTDLADGFWHHIAVVLPDDGSPDISEALLYVDGIPESFGGVAAYPVNTAVTGDVKIGIQIAGTDFYQGLIDDVRIYGYQLSDTDITQLYQQTGGPADELDLKISLPFGGSGTIYYTLDGSDPREAYTGNVVGTLYSGPLTLTRSTRIKARFKNGSNWSALNEAYFSTGMFVDDLRITEIMYHPPDAPISDPNAEFIELTNVGTETLSLDWVRFTDGIDFTFPVGTDLAPSEYILVVRNQAAFEAKYGVGLTIAGQYVGSLDNGGEEIDLDDALSAEIHDFDYKDSWYEITDGGGFSLTIIDPAATDPNLWDEKAGWRPSAAVGGSPGYDDTGTVPALGSVVINEALAHSDIYPNDWIELHNTTGNPINIGGWFLSDNNNDDPNSMKYRIADGISIPANGYIAFTQDDNFGDLSIDSGKNKAFALSENGETVYLRSGAGTAGNYYLTGYYEQEDFGASEVGVAFGRYIKSAESGYDDDFVAMSANTRGSANIYYPKVGPIIISEIMYNPPAGGTYDHDEYEYIELYNISGSEVFLQEWDAVEGENVPWAFTDGIDYIFPLGTSILKGQKIVVVRNKVAFSERYPSVNVSKIYGPFANDTKLSNGGEKIDLGKPGDKADSVNYHYIRVDRVEYSDGSHPEDFPDLGSDPWPTAPDGTGSSLYQKTPTTVGQNYSNDVVNWQGGSPSPGL